ncbi:MAG: hypothetical protein KIH69_022390, partial [Anaerolineae bacterium]|nr:hypothetical protein [Anaerolineae bacterium]
MPSTVARFITAVIILNAFFSIITQWPNLSTSPLGLRTGLAYTPLDYASDRTAFIRQQVPPNASIGFITDLPPGAFEASRAFYEARYALAPRIIEPFTPGRHVWVLGDFEKEAAAPALAAQYNLTLVSPPGERVKLYTA